jgi:hypothetical protein
MAVRNEAQSESYSNDALPPTKNIKNEILTHDRNLARYDWYLSFPKT